MDDQKNPTPIKSGPTITPGVSDAPQNNPPVVPPDTTPIPPAPAATELPADAQESSPAMSGADLPPIVPPPPPKPKTKLIAAIAAVVLLVISIPAGIFLVGQSQEIRKRAQETGPPPLPLIGGEETPTPTPGTGGGPPPPPSVPSPSPEPTPASGKIGQFRRCEINTTTAALENCGSWTAGTLTFDKSISAYGAFTFTNQGKQFIDQFLVEGDGKTASYRKCELNHPSVGAGFDSSSCTAWKQGAAFDPPITSYGDFSFTSGATQYVVQSLVDSDGKSGRYRKCEIVTETGDLKNCGSWTNLTLDFEISAYGAYEFTGSDGKTKVVQSLVDKSGKNGQFRVCPLNTSTGAFENCGKWNTGITFPEEVVAYDAYTMTQPDGKQSVVQSIVTAGAPLPASISATITGPTTAQAGETVKFTGTAQGGNLKWVRVYWAKKEATTEELKKRSTWRGLGEFQDCTGSTCSQEFNFIPPAPGTYLVAVNAVQVDPQGNPIPCSGNPVLDSVKIPSQSPIRGAQDNGWIDCGDHDRIELAATGIFGLPACSEIQLSRAGTTIQASDIKLNDTITATAFCSTTDSTDNFDKVHFRIVSPAGTRADTDKTEVERVASKDAGGKRFYSATQTFKVDQEGGYKIQVWAHSQKKGWGGKQ